jgi:hypothetical protein
MNRYDITLGKLPDTDVVVETPDLSDLWSKRVRQSISSYLGYGIDLLIGECDASVFGGAVRDSLAEQDIHDVDIMALSLSARQIQDRLKTWGYKRIEFFSEEASNLYKGIKKICEPWTYIKGTAIIQVIRPKWQQWVPTDRFSIEDLKADMYHILSEVDISACGVTYRVGKMCNGVLHETCPGAIKDCLEKKFKVFPKHAMYQRDRIYQRIAKLEERGWVQYNEI